MCFSAFSQAEIWTDRIGSGGNNYVFNVKIDPVTFDTYSTGRVKEACTFGESTSSPETPLNYGDRDVFLTKHDVDGELLWVKRFGGLYTDWGEAIELDENYIYLAGYFTDTLYLDTDTLFSSGGQDAFLIKLDKDGVVIWFKTWGGLGNDRISEMKIVNDKIYAIGLYEDSINLGGDILLNTVATSHVLRESAFLMNIDTTGLINWAENMQSTRGVRPVDITFSNGYIYFVGNCYGVTDFSGIPYTSVNPIFYDQFLAKYDENGNQIWCQLYGSNDRDIFTQIDVGGSNNLFVTGYFTGLVTYGSDTYDVPVQSGIILDLDTAGQVNNSFVTYSTNKSLLDGLKFSDGRIFTGGYFQDSVFILDDTLIGNGLLDVLYIEFDEDLMPIDYFSFGGSSHDQIRCLDAVGGHLSIAGSFRYTVDFGSVSYTTIANTFDGFIRAVCPKLLYDIEVSDTSLCVGDTLAIINQGVWTNFKSMNTISGLDTLSFDNDTIYMIATMPGIYTFNVELSTHCSEDTAFGLQFSVYSVPVVNLGPDIIACDDTPVLLTYSGTLDSILWSTSETNVNSIVVSASGNYTIEVWNTDFCSAIDSTLVTFNDCSDISESELNGEIKVFYAENTIHILNIDFSTYDYQIFDSKGVIIQSGELTENSIFIENELGDGIYLLRLAAFEDAQSYKIYISN